MKDALAQYVNKSGICLTGEAEKPIEYFIPYILMDLAYSEFNSVIRPLPLKREMKMLKTRWREENAKFFSDFFWKMGSYTDFIIDCMDEFERDFADIIMVIKCKIMDAVSGIPFEHQKIMAASVFFNLMAQEAQVVYRAKHEKQVNVIVPNGKMGVKHVPEDNDYLARARKYSKEFNEKYYAPFKAKNVKLNDSKPLIEAVDAFENRLMRWIGKSH